MLLRQTALGRWIRDSCVTARPWEGFLGFPGHVMTSVLLQMWVDGWHWVPKTQRTYWEDSQDSGHSCLNG